MAALTVTMPDALSLIPLYLLWLYYTYYGCTYYGCTYFGCTYYGCTYYGCTYYGYTQGELPRASISARRFDAQPTPCRSADRLAGHQLAAARAARAGVVAA